jgi:hypothetical protein
MCLPGSSALYHPPATGIKGKMDQIENAKEKEKREKKKKKKQEQKQRSTLAGSVISLPPLAGTLGPGLGALIINNSFFMKIFSDVD